MAATTTEIKACENPCDLCGGAMYLRIDYSAEGRGEHLYTVCLKCGPRQVLSAISPDDARRAFEEIQKRVANA